MTDEEKIARVKNALDPTVDPTVTDSVITEYLASAQDTILGIMYQLDFEEHTLPAKYHGLQCELAARYFARRGGLGEITHSENGIQRQWASPDDSDLLRRVSPMIKVV